MPKKDRKKKPFDWKAALIPAACATLGLAALGALYFLKRSSVRKASKERLEIVREYSLTVPREETIFVCVPAYRETDAADTVADLFAKARCPFRVFVGVCSQIDPRRDPTFVSEYQSSAKRINPFLGPLMDNVRVFEMDHRSAKGPNVARAYAERELYRNEKYYLIIDAHTRMAQDWDVLCIDNLNKCPGDLPVLTCPAGDTEQDPDYRALSKYHFGSETGRLVPGRNRLTEEGTKNALAKEGTRLAVGTHPDSGPFPRDCLPSFSRFLAFVPGGPEVIQEGRTMASKPEVPVPALFWSSSFSFARAKDFIGKVPHDPGLEHVFFGDCIATSVRLYSHGFDLFHPCGQLAYQKWAREGRRGLYWDLFDRNKHPEPEVEARERDRYRGYERLDSLLERPRYEVLEPKRIKVYGLEDEEQDKPRKPQKVLLPPVPLDQYGLGKVRTLDQYQAYCGLDLRKGMPTARAFCGTTRKPSKAEVAAKYGSATDYYRRLRDHERGPV